MELGALVIAANDTSPALPGLGLWTPSLPVFGKTVLGRWIERVQGLGTNLVSVVNHDGREGNGIRTAMEWAQDGVERVLLIILGSYAEVDLPDVIRFHHEGGNPITNVFDQEGPLGISLLDRDTILKNAGRVTDRQMLVSRYDFRGYVNRLSSTVSYRKLVEDALLGRCGIQPAGLQVGQDIWIHETAVVDDSVQVQGPCYIGPNSKVRPGVTVRGCSSIEHDCEVDVGTTLDRATVLPCTYVAAGLHVQDSVIDGTRLEDLRRGITVNLGPAGLASRLRGSADDFLASSRSHSQQSMLRPDVSDATLPPTTQNQTS